MLCAIILFGIAVNIGSAKYLVNSNLNDDHSSPLKYAGISINSNNNLVKSNAFLPGSDAPLFSVWTLKNGFVTYPSSKLPKNIAIGIHAFSNKSAFLECMWTNTDSLIDFINGSPNGVKYIFMTFEQNAFEVVTWMEATMQAAIVKSNLSKSNRDTFLNNCFYVVNPVDELGNWFSSIFRQWSCSGHGCGFDQIVLTSHEWTPPALVLKRLDARYDWAFKHQWTAVNGTLLNVLQPCNITTIHAEFKGRVALLQYEVDLCSVASQVFTLQRLGAIGVVIHAKLGSPVVEINCFGDECDNPVNIPVMSVPYNDKLIKAVRYSNKTVTAFLQTTSSPNFFVTIDSNGKLAEAGWFLYPSLQFLTWQMQWLEYVRKLKSKISTLNDYVVSVFNRTTMVGKNGTGLSTVTIHDIARYQTLYLDMHLGCTGDMDEDCPPWDHVPVLYVSCNYSTTGMTEIGRWITSFRRGVGHWLTDITPLMPLLATTNNPICTFLLKMNAWWAQPWVATLDLRFVEKPRSYFVAGQWSNEVQGVYPQLVVPLFEGGTFDKSYNAKYKPYEFQVQSAVKRVKLYAVITGHGSDNNNCAEFCPTSHHFTINNYTHVRTFSNAGSPLGCAEQVPQGVVPNEHGTWLYGRDGWCDGQQVDPWIIDITDDLDASINTVTYRGLYKGADPNPSANPGVIRMVSFLVFYA